AAAPARSRFTVTARRPGMLPARGTAGPGGTRSATRPAGITAKPAPGASNGTARPRGWASTPEGAGPATPPAAGPGPRPPRAGGPPTVAPASQHRPAVHTMPYPAPNASRAANRAGKPPASACAAVAAAISRPAARVIRRGPNRSDSDPAGTDTTRVA